MDMVLTVNVRGLRLAEYPCLVILLMLAMAQLASAQSQIVANPKAVKLRRVWTVRGQSGQGFGSAAGAIPDINGDGLAEIVVRVGGSIQCYHGRYPAPDTVPFRTFRST